MIAFPMKRETKEIEALYRREFGRVICSHGIYLPLDHCKTCYALESKNLYRYMFGEDYNGTV